MAVAEDPAADAHDHRTMPPHEGCKGGFISEGDEALQQLPVGHARRLPQQHGLAKMLDDLAHRAGHHVPSSVAGTVVLSLLLPTGRPFDTLLFADRLTAPRTRRARPPWRGRGTTPPPGPGGPAPRVSQIPTGFSQVAGTLQVPRTALYLVDFDAQLGGQRLEVPTVPCADVEQGPVVTAEDAHRPSVPDEGGQTAHAAHPSPAAQCSPGLGRVDRLGATDVRQPAGDGLPAEHGREELRASC